MDVGSYSELRHVAVWLQLWPWRGESAGLMAIEAQSVRLDL